MKNSIFTLIVLCLLSGCTSVKRYKSVNYLDCKVDERDSLPDGCKQYVTMSLFSSTESNEPDKSNSTKTLWDLQSEGQSTLIDKLNNRYPDKDDFKEQLENEYLEEVADQNYTVKKIKAIFSVSKLRDYKDLTTKKFSLADRIEYLKFSLSLVTPDVEFIKWNKFATEFAEIEIADVTFEQNIEAGIRAGNETTPLGSDIKAGLKKSELQKIKHRYATLNGKLSKYKLEAEEEGTSQIDLNGNVIIDLTLKFKSSVGYFAEFSGLKKADGNFNEIQNVELVREQFLLPAILQNTDLLANLSYNYIYRNVSNKKGSRTYLEKDDAAIFIEGSGTEKNIPLLQANELKPNLWLISLDNEFLSLFINSIPTNNTDLNFNSMEKAHAFGLWLRDFAEKNQTSTAVLKFGDHKLYLNNMEVTGKILYEKIKNIDVKNIRA